MYKCRQIAYARTGDDDDHVVNDNDDDDDRRWRPQRRQQRQQRRRDDHGGAIRTICTVATRGVVIVIVVVVATKPFKYLCVFAAAGMCTKMCIRYITSATNTTAIIADTLNLATRSFYVSTQTKIILVRSLLPKVMLLTIGTILRSYITK